MTQDLQARCSAAFEHMHELVDKLPEMQLENGRLQRAENAAAVQVCEQHYLALKNMWTICMRCKKSPLPDAESSMKQSQIRASWPPESVKRESAKPFLQMTSPIMTAAPITSETNTEIR